MLQNMTNTYEKFGVDYLIRTEFNFIQINKQTWENIYSYYIPIILYYNIIS